MVLVEVEVLRQVEAAVEGVGRPVEGDAEGRGGGRGRGVGGGGHVA